MSRNSVSRLEIALCLALSLASARLFAAERPYQGDVKEVVTIDTLEDNGPYDKIWEPYIAQWNGQHLVAAYGLQLRGKPDMGDIVCSISRDGGKSWGPRILIFDHRQRNGTVQYAYNNSVLFRPPRQDVIWLFCMRTPLHHRDSENANLAAAYTADGGLSWHPVEMAMDYQGAIIIVAGIETVMRNGVPHYLLPGHRNTQRREPHGDRRQFVLESTSLLHWKLAGYVEYPENDPVFLHEGNIAVTENAGELKIVMRTADMQTERALDPPLAYSSISKDGGKTWSVAKPEPDLPNYRSKSFFGKSANGQHIYVYSNQVERRGLYYKTKSQGGKWSEEKTFYDADNKNSYPTLIEDKPGEWLCVWDSSNEPDRPRTAIRFGRFEFE